jgi:N-carbamoylputrescine amidase
MRAALAVHRVVADPAANLVTIERAAQAAADAGAELVVFSETALTGFIGNDDPAHDRPLAQPVPGPATERLATLARERGLWIAFGLYERTQEDGQECLYDAAVLLGPDGATHLHYRRLTPQWHWPSADPKIYQQGTELPVATTPFGTCAFLLCGDLFNEAVVNRLRRLRPDWLLFPFARRFDSEVADAAHWEQAERLNYARQAGRARVGALMVNYLADSRATGGCFGGALVVTRDGTIVSSLPPGQEDLLLVDLARVP